MKIGRLREVVENCMCHGPSAYINKYIEDRQATRTASGTGRVLIYMYIYIYNEDKHIYIFLYIYIYIYMRKAGYEDGECYWLCVCVCV
jgi:hypothetical protein